MAVANFNTEDNKDLISPSFLRDPGGCDQRIRGRKWDSRSAYSAFRENPLPSTKNSGGGIATGTAGDTNRMYIGRQYFEYYVRGGQAILEPAQGTYGMDFGFDQIANHGVEVTNGITARTGVAYQPGVDAPFFFRLKLRIAQANGVNPCVIGFRKAGAYNSTYTAYTDYASIGVIGTSRHIQIDTNLNNGGHGVTDSTQTWSDGSTHELKVLVDGAGAVTYQIDGVAPTVSASYSFQSGLTVVPYFTHINTSPYSGELSFLEWEVGFQ